MTEPRLVPEVQLSETYDFRSMVVDTQIPEGLPYIVDRVSLAYAIGVTPRMIGQVIHTYKNDRGRWVYNKNNYYHTYEIPKRQSAADKAAGIQRMRKIQAPRHPLKAIQRGLAANFWDQFAVHPAVTSYVPGMSIRDTAVQHAGKDIVVCIDIQDYFPSIKEIMIRQFLEQHGYSKLLARTISELCTFRCFLAQGSPCSPIVSNILGSHLFDGKVQVLAESMGYHYTRYADDLIFSKEVDPDIETSDADALVAQATQILAGVGFRVATRKTKFMRKTSPKIRQRVLGLNVDSKLPPHDPNFGSDEPFVRVSRHTYRQIRSMLHDALTYGVEGAARKRKLSGNSFFAKLQSYIKSYLGQCDERRHAKLIDDLELVKALWRREGGPAEIPELT
jgi:hypothetical protein